MSVPAKEFVMALEIDPPSERGQMQLEAGKVKIQLKASGVASQGEEGFVDGGSMVSFVSNISSQHRKDVLNSTLLAQLAADKKFDRNEQTDQWYKFYVNVLGKIGWVIQDMSFEKYQSSGESLVVQNVILEIAAEILSGNELAALERTIEALKSGSNDGWWIIFSKKGSGPSKYGNFQVSPCQEDASGQVIMKLASFYFEAESTEQRWLWFEYNATNIKLFKGHQVSTLNEIIYSKVRQSVIEKLGDNAKDYIGDLDI